MIGFLKTIEIEQIKCFVVFGVLFVFSKVGYVYKITWMGIFRRYCRIFTEEHNSYIVNLFTLPLLEKRKFGVCLIIFVYNHLSSLMQNVIAFEYSVQMYIRLILLTVMGVMFLGVYRICKTRKSIEQLFNIKTYHHDEFIFYL